jgi:hypothetical protein
MLKKKQEKAEELKGESQNKRIYIDWGRQGGVFLGYTIIVLGFYGIIANTMMIDDFGKGISFVDMDRTILFWTYTTYIWPNLEPVIFVLLLLAITSLIIVFSLIDWHSSVILLILIPVYIAYALGLYWNLFNLVTVVTSGEFYYTIQGFTIILLFLVCFGLTYKEDIPQYGIKASIWLVPLIIAIGFLFYANMFGFSIEPLILQFGNGEGWINILILVFTMLSGSLSGMKIKQKVIKRKELSELGR